MGQNWENMSGHNKWSKVKHRKEAQDKKKSKIFSILSKQISIAAREAKGDKNSPTLRAAIEKARSVDMPNANIDRAIEKATGAGAANFEKVVYEAYGPGGVAIMIEGVTDNKNRTSQEIKHLLSEHDITLGTPGSAAWAFQGDVKMDLSPADQEKLTELIAALEDHEDVTEVKFNAKPSPDL